MSVSITTRNNVEVISTASYDDWFLPSMDELNAMRTELYLYGLGGWLIGDFTYLTSSEISSIDIWVQAIDTGEQFSGNKSGYFSVYPCRSFISLTNYNLRDIGPAGGRIFWKSGNDYLESAPSDIVNTDWSNITDRAIGTTGIAIGTGQANTLAIINQVGHTDSAAKLCNDLVV